jgi:hypothetical protein
MRALVLAFSIFGLASAAGCAPQIGDSCTTSVNCSVNGDRVCDGAQPGGYCSIESCEADTCPEDAVCVRFRPTPSRHAQSWCMKPCESSSDCRVEDAYGCFSEGELNACAPFEPDPSMPDVRIPVLEILDQERTEDEVRFCAVAPAGCTGT